MPRLFLSLLSLVLLAGCAKPDLPDLTVRADTAEALAAFRAELGQRFAPERLAIFDTALQELQLAGMDLHPTAAARAAAMREQVNGRTVRAVEILGWQARRARLSSEIASLTPTLEQDLKTRAAKGADTPPVVLNRIQNVQEILEKLRRHLAETETRLAALGTKPGS